MALAYSAAQELDGEVPDEFIVEKLPDPEERAAVLDALEGTGLFERNGRVEVIHDFADFNPTRTELGKRRRTDAKRKRKTRAHRGG
jgi:hypothetical protein